MEGRRDWVSSDRLAIFFAYCVRFSACFGQVGLRMYVRSGDGKRYLIPLRLAAASTNDPVIKTLFFRWTWILHPNKPLIFP